MNSIIFDELAPFGPEDWKRIGQRVVAMAPPGSLYRQMAGRVLRVSLGALSGAAQAEPLAGIAAAGLR